MRELTHEQRALADAAQANKLNIVHHAYVDISGDLIAGALLGQILFWFGTGKDGTSRAKIQKDGHTWIAKARGDWWHEIRISPKQYDRAAKILRERGFIEVRTFKFQGNPTSHIRIVPEAINAALDDWKWEQVKTLSPVEEKPAAAGYSPMGNNVITHRETTGSPDREPGYSPKVNNDIPQKSITSYTENTNRENDREHTHREGAAKPQESAPALHNDLVRHQETKAQIEADFERCWDEYPKKEGKAKARRAFEKAVRRGGITADEILAEIVLYRQWCEQQIESGELEKRYIPTGGAWFEGERWIDDTPIAKPSDYVAASNYRRTAYELRASAQRGERERVRALIATLTI